MKFLVNSMLGKLVRFLRIFGYDSIYANDLEEYFHESPVQDENLLLFAIKENRMVITRDYPFHINTSGRSVYLEGEGVYNYLKQLKNKLNLNYDFNMENARCSLCNSELERVDNKDLIKEKVQLETFRHYQEFFLCQSPNCKNVYWKGTHIENLLNKLKEKVE